MKEKALFESALDNKDLSGKEPLLDETGEFLNAEMPDTVAEPPILEKEVNSPMNDDDDPLFSELSVAENEDHSEDETPAVERDPITEESRDVLREPLRLPQRRLRLKQPAAAY